jgi:tRNA threonylcarbamoyladenosine biosynthesis protein TsaE
MVVLPVLIIAVIKKIMAIPYSTAQFKLPLPDEAATDALGACLAHQLKPGLKIYLYGELGAGKTTLTRALLRAAGYEGHVKSPTYTLAESYDVVIGHQHVTVMHFDLYRMSSAQEFLDAGFRDVFNARTICIVEWPDNGKSVLPSPDIEIHFTIDHLGRLVELRALSEKGRLCLTQLHFAPNM